MRLQREVFFYRVFLPPRVVKTAVFFVEGFEILLKHCRIRYLFALLVCGGVEVIYVARIFLIGQYCVGFRAGRAGGEHIVFVDFIDGDNRFRVRLKDIRVTPVCTVLAQFAAVIIIPKAVLTNSDFLADEIAVIVIFVLSMVPDGNNTGNRDFGFCIPL